MFFYPHTCCKKNIVKKFFRAIIIVSRHSLTVSSLQERSQRSNILFTNSHHKFSCQQKRKQYVKLQRRLFARQQRRPQSDLRRRQQRRLFARQLKRLLERQQRRQRRRLLDAADNLLHSQRKRKPPDLGGFLDVWIRAMLGNYVISRPFFRPLI